MVRDPHVLDAYVLDTLMADLVGHDRRPAAFLTYLAITAAQAGRSHAALSYAALAERTGLSKRTVQTSVAILRRRGLVEVLRRGPTETPQYRALTPWRGVRPLG